MNPHIWNPVSAVGLAAVLCVASGWISPAAADVPAGYDLFETGPSATAFNGSNLLPAGFFGPGSDPFTGTVPLRGVPILPPSFMNSTDTIVHRLQDASLTGNPPQGAVPIEIVALSLMSTDPITVTYSGGQDAELWDVMVTHSPVAQPPGSMQIQNAHPNGGTFSSSLNVTPVFTFVRRGDGMMVQETRPQLASEFCQYASTVPPGTNVADNAVFPSGGQFFAARNPNNGQALGLTMFGGQGLTLNQRAASSPAPFDGHLIVFDTEMLSMDLHSSEPIHIPLGSNYAEVQSNVTVSLSSQRQNNPGPASTAQITARNLNPNPDAPAINPAALDGQPFMVSSFFDVFFDITITDVDPNNNFFNNQPQIQLVDNRLQMFNNYPSVFNMTEPSYGLLPLSDLLGKDPSGTWEINVGDVNNDSLLDTLQFGRLDNFVILYDVVRSDSVQVTGSAMGTFDGEVNPPFGPFTLSGPTTATTRLLTPVVPEPATLALLAVGGLLAARRWRSSRRFTNRHAPADRRRSTDAEATP